MQVESLEGSYLVASHLNSFAIEEWCSLLKIH